MKFLDWGEEYLNQKKYIYINDSNRTSSVNVFVILKIENVNIGVFPSIEK